MAKILLVNPKKDVPLLDWAMRYPPLGLMYVAAVLNDHDVEMLDLKVEKIKTDDLIRKIFSVDILGISVLTPSIDAALELCRYAKNFNVTTVLGGVHPSLNPNIVENPEVDIVVRGEGEYTFKDIADGKPWETIDGISYKKNGEVVHNPDRAPADLDALPPPRRDLFSKYAKKYKAWGQKLDAISTARGCPYNCSFCCVPRVWKGYREQSPKQVVEEIKRMNPKAETIAIVDDNFCHNMKRVKEICQLIIENGLNQQYKYSVFSRIDSIVRHPDVVEVMAKANMRIVFIGIEAATQEALDKMHKGTKIEDIYKACDILEKAGAMIWAGHIIGNLDDKWEDVEELIKFSKKLPTDVGQFTIITPYPGTELYDLAKDQNLIDNYDVTSFDECCPSMHTPHLSRLELMELEIKAYLKFYGVWTMIKRTRRWKRNKEKKWMAHQGYRTYRSFMKFRNKSARYLIKTYKEVVGESEGTSNKLSQKISQKLPIVTTPRLFSFTMAFWAAAIVLTLTDSVASEYGDYFSLGLEAIFIDLVAAGILVGAISAFISTILAVYFYRRGWILSLSQRKPKRGATTPFTETIKNGFFYGIYGAIFMAIVAGIVLYLFQIPITYDYKTSFVSALAFLITYKVSFKSIHAVRNGDIV